MVVGDATVKRAVGNAGVVGEEPGDVTAHVTGDVISWAG